MTSASTMAFSPEWMRRKPSQLSTNQTGSSPGTTSSMLPTPPTAAPALPNVSSYSSLLATASPQPEIKSEDESYPFRYSKDQLLRVWKDGGGRGGLGLEVERWPGIVREVGGEPLGVKEMTQEERKLFSSSVNSDPPMRRNAANLSLAPERQNSKFGQGVGIGLGPASPRGMGMPRRRATGNADDPTAPFMPRKLSLSSTLMPGAAGNGPASPSGPLASPNTRTRLDNSDPAGEPWTRGQPAEPAWNGLGARRRTNESVGTRVWGNPAGAPNIGLGIGRGISFGSLTNGTNSGTGSVDEKISPSVSPGPDPASNVDAIAPVPEHGTLLAGTGRMDRGETLQNPTGTSTIYATNGIVSAPPGLSPEPTEDLANIQWSYKDPTGQIQGPFLGSAMQLWFEHGYFTEDLLIKRTTIDLDFEPLVDFRRRAPPLRPGETHVQLFLAPLAPRAPPNLPPVQSHLLGNNTPPNPSPRVSHLMTGVLDSSSGPMSAGVSSGSPLGNSPALSAARSTTLDSYLGPTHERLSQNGPTGSPLAEGLVVGGSTLSNVALERKKREDFIQSLRERELAMGVGAPTQPTLGSTGPFGGAFMPNPTMHHAQFSPFSGNVALSPSFNSRLNMQVPPAPLHAPVSNIGLSAVSPFPHNGPVLWASSEPQLAAPGSYGASPGFEQAPIYQSAPQNPIWQEHIAPQESIWESAPEQQSLPPAVEAAANIAEEHVATPMTDSHVHDSPSSLQPSLPAEPETESVIVAPEQAAIQEEPVNPREVTPEPASEPIPATATATVSPTPSSKRKNTGKSKAAKEPVVPAPTPAAVPAPTSSPVPTPAKAWATLEEDKPASLSLREIQEAEARKAEAARKASKASAPVPVPAPAPVSNDEPTNVTGSWGLPQVGARSNTSAPTSTNGSAPAWTKPVAAPVGKKSMKEIQEEEEKRKKAAAVKEAQSAAAAQQAAKRAYAESAKNVSAAPTGGAWTTVGAQGKTAVPPAAVRQSSQPAPRAPTAPNAVRPSSSASTTQPSSSTTKPAKPAVPDEAPVPPSLDFLKWLKEALKGLNGVNVEEFMQMLLSFPLDPSPAVIEIISDSIYANSSTLDGRRFAAEFCQKRKADAAAARLKPTAASGAKVPRASVAEVVKTQPKPVQSDWGFKTVQKKAKGSRK